jgi:hypothetical protein
VGLPDRILLAHDVALAAGLPIIEREVHEVGLDCRTALEDD